MITSPFLKITAHQKKRHKNMINQFGTIYSHKITTIFKIEVCLETVNDKNIDLSCIISTSKKSAYVYRSMIYVQTDDITAYSISLISLDTVPLWEIPLFAASHAWELEREPSQFVDLQNAWIPEGLC